MLEIATRGRMQPKNQLKSDKNIDISTIKKRSEVLLVSKCPKFIANSYFNSLKLDHSV